MTLIPDIFWHVSIIDPLLTFGVNHFFHKKYIESREPEKHKICSLILNSIGNSDLIVEMLDNMYINNFKLDLLPSWENIIERIWLDITPFKDYAYFTENGKIWESHSNRILELDFQDNTIKVAINRTWQYHTRYLAQYRKTNKVIHIKYRLGFDKRSIIDHFNDMFNGE